MIDADQKVLNPPPEHPLLDRPKKSACVRKLNRLKGNSKSNERSKRISTSRKNRILAR
jgi:hypothetical protein